MQRMSSSQANPNGLRNADADTSNAPRRGMILPFQPLAMSFDSVNYFVDMPAEMKEQGVTEDRLQLLREVTGSFRPGVLTALMGVSGAGKTTLMDVLAGRKTGGYIEGDVKISGYPKNQETFARVSGYCEQTDIHSPQVTIRESLLYSAFLQLPKEVGDEEKIQFVEQVMDLVELQSLRDAIVGLPGVTGLSTEQRKTLTIAVELVANPSIIFMDEPTSGLDARAAAIVMRTVRNTVDTGRTVVCTIHQPSIDIFEAFDELILMKRGGQLIYGGPLGRNSHKIIEYFEAIQGVPKIKDMYNPATWMLEVSSVAAEVRLGMDFAEYYKQSDLFRRSKALVTELSTPPPGTSDLFFATKYSQSTVGQFKSYLWKQWLTYWRSPDYNLVRYFFTLACALMIGSVFWRVGKHKESSTDLTLITGAMYASVIFVGINNCQTVQPIVAIERTVFYRERAAGMYAPLPYALAQVLIEVPFVLFQTLYYSLIVYAMVAFPWKVEKFFWFVFVSFFSFLYFTYYGMMTVSITPNHQVASIFAAAFYGVFNLFSGFFIPKPKIPGWWIWYYWICPVAWTVYGLIVSQYRDIDDPIFVPGATQNFTVKGYIEHHYGFKPDFMGPVAAVLCNSGIVGLSSCSNHKGSLRVHCLAPTKKSVDHRPISVVMATSNGSSSTVSDVDDNPTIAGGVRDVYGEDRATEDQFVTPWSVSVSSGYTLLRDPHFNKGLAFTETERDAHYLRGLLPPTVISQETQVKKMIQNIRQYQVPLQKYMAMMDLQERNERLFYRLLIDHVEELLPFVYTPPTVGEACQKYGSIFMHPQGLYISLKEKGRILQVLRNWPEKNIQVIVVTDGERILGLGDLGCQGMGIPVGKLSLYTALGGVRPSSCLPITIDVGTNNEKLLNDELYIGLKHKRVTGKGTASVVLAGLVSALKLVGGSLDEHRFLFLGAGEAGTGIAELIALEISKRTNSQLEEVRKNIWLVDSKGLIVSSRKESLQHFKKPWAHDHEPVTELVDAVNQIKPTVLIGTSGQGRTFTQEVIKAMASINEKPIILSLSNPTSQSECTAEEAYTWTEGRAIFASGSPFAPVEYDGKVFVPGQSNNAYIFPGFGLGLIMSGTIRVHDDLLLAASEALASQVTQEDYDRGLIYPPFTSIRKISAHIAAKVASKAYELGLATRLPRPKDLLSFAESCMYTPTYRSYR
ncbi:NADP-dependent malic enzyme [Trifolium repens]|nr:NADP-dependent malic enzyme [Trifolium repens]